MSWSVVTCSLTWSTIIELIVSTEIGLLDIQVYMTTLLFET